MALVYLGLYPWGKRHCSQSEKRCSGLLALRGQNRHTSWVTLCISERCHERRSRRAIQFARNLTIAAQDLTRRVRDLPDSAKGYPKAERRVSIGITLHENPNSPWQGSTRPW